MLPDDYLEIRKGLKRSVINYYKALGREVDNFLETKNEEWGWTYLHFLVDRRRVIKYGFGIDRNILRGGVSIAIGPHYFNATSFWSYENSRRFDDSLDEQSIHQNLRLLDEFWKKPSYELIR